MTIGSVPLTVLWTGTERSSDGEESASLLSKNPRKFYFILSLSDESRKTLMTGLELIWFVLIDYSGRIQIHV